MVERAIFYWRKAGKVEKMKEMKPSTDLKEDEKTRKGNRRKLGRMG
jgi:hypothetical protein